jgi:Gram-negative bacterial TonB protein C-terminal
MTVAVRCGLLGLCLLTGAACSSLDARPTQQAIDTLFDEQVKLASFEDMQYPLVARRTNVQGVVVIRAMLDDEGRVAEASAISGASFCCGTGISRR